MGKNANLEKGRDASIGLLNNSLLQMQEKYADRGRFIETI